MWLVFLTEPGSVHVIPNADLIEHEKTGECVCGPEVTDLDEDKKLFMHASLDGREHANSSNDD